MSKPLFEPEGPPVPPSAPRPPTPPYGLVVAIVVLGAGAWTATGLLRVGGFAAAGFLAVVAVVQTLRASAPPVEPRPVADPEASS